VFPIKTAALKILTLKVVLLSSVRQCFLQIERRLALTPQGGGDSGSFKGEGGWYLGVVESMGHTPKIWKFENWNLNENCYTRNTSNTTK